jgi:hypothetical protein
VPETPPREAKATTLGAVFGDLESYWSMPIGTAARDDLILLRGGDGGRD